MKKFNITDNTALACVESKQLLNAMSRDTMPRVSIELNSGEVLTIPTIVMEKFAELLIKECISTLEEKIYQSIDNDGDEVWADLILKQHFGVEE